MENKGQILIADDEKLFRESLSDRLCQEGFICDCASEASEAVEKLKSKQYDALISDIRMPGNANLEFIHNISETNADLPIILVTGYPSLNTAIESVGLSVMGYLVKPVNPEEMIKVAHRAVRFNRLRDTVSAVHEKASQWQEGMKRIQDTTRTSRKDVSKLSVDKFLDLTLSSILGSLMDLRNLTEAYVEDSSKQFACHMLNCPYKKTLKNGLEQAVTVLNETKTQFKSKRLADLRRNLETILRDSEK